MPSQGWHDATQVIDTFTTNDLDMYLDVVNEDFSTLEDFNSDTLANEGSTQAISTCLDLLNQIFERQYYYNMGTNQICHKAIKKMLRNKSLDKGKSRTHQQQNLR